MDKFWNDYPEIQRDLEEVINIMKKSFSNGSKFIQGVLRDMIHAGGKMIRPAFVILGGRFGQYDRKKLCPLAAVVEMLHLATLIHDDIIDNALIRRSKPTIQAEHGKNYAVFIGDFLFSQCFLLLSDNIAVKDIKKVSKSVSRICKGEIEQFESQYDVNVTVTQYLRRIAAKTAVLFALSLYIGAYESNCGESLSRALASIGYNVGMAFQIIDDILDFTGEERVVGKPLGNDIRQGIFTLPMIYALQEDERGEMSRMLCERPYSEEQVKRFIEFARQTGGIERARKLARKYTQKAFDKISSLKECPSKQVLAEITEKLLYRVY
ncbi:heptaprenyl diphosphate synthase [Caldanaerobius fijiensis DSM 17918]|uniref:Heptaprenyl diphosphate synthase n=1 Tax=Caldanaerobius fijiensis DSM 17918 TaxID=1121256 RepID=A0A1M5CNV7_9THEO|nr:polyprenyl synthetase family protein [Caldanaerobius fijiensis]SHF56389.1 heptaprenyl diphosphate synthase [Caldanaerobius fijiensis DSM 17918]